ncbi:MAG: TonB-dependent receptor [Sphingomonadales bacterium]|nr:MAG: TonB-dependent receptor [Sphingomonadales bacterium]
MWLIRDAQAMMDFGAPERSEAVPPGEYPAGHAEKHTTRRSRASISQVASIQNGNGGFMTSRVGSIGRKGMYRLLLSAAAICTAAPALAQSAPGGTVETKEAEDQDSEAIVVTGSLLARSGFDAPTPVTSIGGDDLARVGAPDIAQVINQIPSVRSSVTTATSANFSTLAGGSYIDLRGLGYQRTQILIDGRRYVPSTPSGGINISAIPQALIRGVDVVTGGASAAYGSDAVAGVVNFLIDDQFEGVKGKLQGGITDHDDYRNYLASVAIGKSFAGGRLHVVAAFEAASNGGIDFVGDRDWGNNPARIANPASTNTNSEPRNLIVSNAKFSNVSYGGVINSPNALKGLQFTPDGQAIPFKYGTLVSATTMVGGDGANATADSVSVAPSERYAGFGRVTFEASDALTLSAEVNYSKVEANFLNLSQTDQITIRADNPYLPASVRTVMANQAIASFVMGRSANDYARVKIDLDIETIQAVLGAKGDLGGSWKWSAYYSYGHSDHLNRQANSRINANFALATDAVINPANGAIVCRSTLTNPTNGCVPINLIGEGNVSAAAAAYVNGVSRRKFELDQHVVSATVRGEPFSTWAGPVGVAFGAEHRTWKVVTTSDPISAVQAFRNGGTVPYTGQVTVKEAFGEILVPLAKDEGWAKDLSLNLAGRVTDYSTSGVVKTWKAGLSYALNDSIRLRATRSRDIRAPGLEELFAGGATTLLNVQDRALNNESYQVRATNTGNRNLVPERADTLTAGIVLTPDFLRGFRFSVDYYDIRINDAIISLTPATIVDQCFTTAPQLCSLISRGSDGRITQVQNGPVNLQNVQVRGVDFEMAYGFRGLGGDIDLRALATYIDKAVIIDGVTTLEVHDAVNQASSTALGGSPRWRFNTSASYETERARLSVTARYIGGGRIDPAFTAKDIDVLRVDGRLYVDLSGEYSLVKGDSNSVALFGTIQNLLDKDPPITTVQGYGTTRALYDTIGRVYTLGVKFKF